MTTNETVFFIHGSYILLVDLESWYDNGFVTPEDEVQMFDGKKKQVCTINDENLIPDLTKYSKGQLLGERWMKQELDLNLSDEILKELGPMDLTDYPLFNLDNEPEEDRITGKDIEIEFMKLRNSLVIKNWNQLYAKYFNFLERGYKGDDLKRTQPICRLCNETPRHLFLHLFSKEHFESLKSQSVSRRSFEFWEYQFRECIYECGQSFGADLKTYDYITETINEELAVLFEEEDKIEAISPSYSPSQLLAQRSLATKVNLKPPVGPQRPPQPQQMPPQMQHQNEQQIGNQESYAIDQFRPESPPPVQGYQHQNNAQQAQYYAGSVIQQGVPYQQGYSGGEGGGQPIMQLMPPHGQQALQHIQQAVIYGMQMPTAMYIPMPPPIVVRRQPVVNSRSDTVKDSGNQSSAWKNKRKSEIEQLEEGPQSQHETSVQQQQPPPPPPQQHQQQPQPPQGYQEFVPKLSYCRSQLLAQRSLKTTVDLNLSKYILKELGPMDLVDYPLLNVDNEPEEDRITGEAILKEFSKLKQTWVLQNWNSKYAKYFEYLDRGYKGNGLKRTQPICRICIYNGKPKNLMKHLFGSFHSGYMKNHSVSLRSFEFWSQKLQECLEKCGKISGVYIGNYDQQVLKAYKDQHKQKKKMRQGKEKKVPSRIQVLAERLRETSENLSSFEHFLKVANVEDEPKEHRVTENFELEMLKNEESTEVFDDVESEKEEIETFSPSYSRSQLLALRSLGTKVDLNLSEDILKELGRIHLIDYPLFNVDNEPEEDRITGSKVLKEFKKLRQTWVLQNWNSKYAKYFEYLDRGYKGNDSKRTQPICRICKETPKNLMRHLFGSFHSWRMIKYSVSLRSFEFWSQKLQECLEKCGKRSGVNIGNYDQQVLKAYKDQHKQKKKMRQEKRELEVAINEELAEMFDEEESEIEKTGSISAQNKLLAEPSLEEMMSLIVSEMKSKKVGPMDLDVENEPKENRITENRELEMPINEQLTDMLNAEKIEIEEIETISPSYSRSQLLAQRSLETTVKLNLSEDILKELGLMDLIDYPLLNVDNEPEEDRITGDAILKEFNKLKQSCVVKHWNILYALHFEFLNRGYKGDGLKMTQPICRICNMRPTFALQHLLSYKHKENLKSHSVSLRSFEFWSQKFEECTKRCGKVASVLVCEARPID